MRRQHSWVNGVLAAVLIYAALLVGPTAGFDAGRILREIAENPQLLLQQLLIGLANGAIIAVIALGYTLVYGIIELINFAHGDLFMLGVFASLSVVGTAGVTQHSPGPLVFAVLALAFLVATAFCAGLNVLIERVAYRRLRNAPRLAPLISAIGVSFILMNMGLFWGSLRVLFPFMGASAAAAKNFPDLLPRVDVLKSLGLQTAVTFTTKDLTVIVVATILMLALRMFVQRTKLGKAMRATAQNRDAAMMMGINIDQVIALTFLLGGALAGAAGLLVGLYNNTAMFTMGFTAGLRAFTAAVLGGIGNITGAMLGGILIGLLAAFSDQYFSARWTDAWVFAILVIILIFRPTGLLGERVVEKA
jgi:branched-chain amino acid transport system permease protein